MDLFKKTYSPSSDKSTFLLCTFNGEDIEGSIEFHEFKVVQNNSSQKAKAHNAWVVVESEKVLQ